jgi:hypothetical protein
LVFTRHGEEVLIQVNMTGISKAYTFQLIDVTESRIMPHRHKRNQDDRKHEAGEQSNPLDLMFAGLSMPAPLAAMADLNTKLMAAFASTSEEWAKFVAGRLQEDVRLSRDLAACQTPPEYMNVYRDFYNQAWKDYQREFARLAETGQSLAAETADVMRAAASESK